MLILYIAAIVLSALLLFLVQPMMAKMVLPQFGGSPSVWNTCMLFFQTLLLVGYAYAHWLTRSLRPARQLSVHVAVLLLPIVVLPIGSAAGIELFSGASPVLQLLGWLLIATGAPFFVLATSAPLLQQWFSSTDHPDAADPYFLYAASNAGSVIALLAYPILVEPMLRIATPGATFLPPRFGGLSQTLVWSIAYVALVALVSCAGVSMLRHPGRTTTPGNEAELDPTSRVSGHTRLQWILLALVPSSAMLGATQYLTSAIVAAPLLWVIPLLLYLLTFILAFSRRTWIPVNRAGIALAILVAVVAGTLFSQMRLSVGFVLPLHLLTLFAVGMVCHGRLAAIRPAPIRLTQFYLMIALGGALGGAFNAIVAPILFDSVLEYPLVLIAACWLCPARTDESDSWITDLTAAALMALLILGADLVLWGLLQDVTAFVPLLRAAVPTAVLLFFVFRRRRFALSLAVVLAIGWLGHHLHDTVLHTERTFYGIHTVVKTEGPELDVIDSAGNPDVIHIPSHKLIHGPISHGSQAQAEALRRTPTTYYHRSGPIGQVFARLGGPRSRLRVGLIGLGAGTLAAYGRQGMHFTYYEIDAEVVKIARNPNLFTYIEDSRAEIDFVVGDGRLMLAREPDAEFDIVVLDAFNSDSVPVHLITREAVRLYLRKLKPGGLLAMHMSTRYLDLDPVVEAIARDLGIARITQHDEVVGLDQVIEGKAASTWTLLAKDPTALRPFLDDPRWTGRSSSSISSRHLWTDDFSNIVGVLDLR